MRIFSPASASAGRAARITRWAVVLTAGALMVTGCGANNDSGGPAKSQETQLTVHAAASLKAPFDQLAKEFEADHPNVDVRVTYGGSSALVQQLEEGAPGDVFASADERTMDQAEEAGLVDGDPRTFARNTLVLVVPKANPAGISSFEDATRQGVKLVTCAPEVPCGAATEQLMEQNGDQIHPVSQESSVTDVMGKVRSGEADAGIVYVSEARNAGDQVIIVDIPQSQRVVNKYRIAELKHAKSTQLAEQFEDLVMSDKGQRTMEAAGFDTP